MSVFYRLHQDKSVGTKRSGKWYARAVSTSVINTRQLADIMQRNCTVKRSDILAVIEELVETMRDQLQDSKHIKLDGFGSFKIGVRSKAAESAEKFSASDNIRGLHVVFLPERSTDNAGNRIKQFLQGAKVEELPLNMIERKKSTSPTPNPSQSLTPNPSPTGEENQSGDNGDQPDMD